jgi:hypothetical protein
MAEDPAAVKKRPEKTAISINLRLFCAPAGLRGIDLSLRLAEAAAGERLPGPPAANQAVLDYVREGRRPVRPAPLARAVA